MLHLVDRFFVGMGTQPTQSPVVEHACVQKVLIDGSQLILEHGIEMAKDGGITLHARIPGQEDKGDAELSKAMSNWRATIIVRALIRRRDAELGGQFRREAYAATCLAEFDWQD